MTARKAAGDSGSKLANGDVFLFHDAGKPATIEAVHKALVRDRGRFAVVAKSENLAKLVVHVCLAEESLKQRRALTRGRLICLPRPLNATLTSVCNRRTCL